jgi:anti-anti-sigma factor
MEITPTHFKHCDLIKLSGRVDSASSPTLADAIKAITDEGRFKLVLDLSNVTFMSSAGLRILVNVQKMCKRYNRGEVILASVPSNIYASLDLAGFTTLFKFYDDTLTAVAYF